MSVTLDSQGNVHVEPAVFTRDQWEQFLFEVNCYTYEYPKLQRDAMPVPLASVLTATFI